MNHTKTTYTYKVVDRCALHADVYATHNRAPGPALLWLHGGGLIFGSRQMLRIEQAEQYLQAGFAIVAADYRLAPETKATSIVEDIVDAYHWIQSESEKIGIDARRIAIVGHSAGGYLALSAALHLAPKAVISFYGYGDISGEWATKPNPFYRQQGLISEDSAFQNIGSETISECSVQERLQYYLFCRQQGIWVREIVGGDADNHDLLVRQYCPVYAISSNFSPTLLLHGDQDIDVPVSESHSVAEKLSGAEVKHQQIILPGYGHAFDITEDGMQDQCVAQAFSEVLEFLTRNCG
jgi:acetyl esterase/lipase